MTSQVQYFATGTSGTDFAISSATDTHTFNLPTASATNRGALSSADWTTFNNKENVLTFTTPLSRATNTISIPQATSSVSGFLSSTDWTTFNSKQNSLTNPITGTGSAGQVAYFTGATTQAGSNSLFWDNTNAALAIGGTTIDANIALQINSVKGVKINGSGGGFGYQIVRGTETSAFNNNSTATILSSTNTLIFNTGGAEAARFISSQRLLIGSTTDSGQRLQVTGTALITGASTFGGNMSLTLNQNGITSFTINNTTSGTNSVAAIILISDTTSGQAQLGKRSSLLLNYKFLLNNDTYLYNGTTAGDIAILNDFATGNIKFAAGGSSTEHMRLTSAGNLCIGVTIGGAFLNIGAGTTAKAQINLASSTAPSSPTNGDIWFDGTNLRMRIGGVTRTFTLT